MLLGLKIQYLIPRFEKENEAFGKALTHLIIKIIVKPGLLESWVIKEDWFQDQNKPRVSPKFGKPTKMGFRDSDDAIDCSCSKLRQITTGSGYDGVDLCKGRGNTGLQNSTFNKTQVKPSHLLLQSIVYTSVTLSHETRNPIQQAKI